MVMSEAAELYDIIIWCRCLFVEEDGTIVSKKVPVETLHNQKDGWLANSKVMDLSKGALCGYDIDKFQESPIVVGRIEK